MSDGNKRYLGDVFINSENYERQAQFFRDIIESYQWKYNGTFDAATLQGKDADQFATAEQGRKSDNAILAPLLLGRSSIENDYDVPQYIYTDAVLLDRENEDIPKIQWFSELENDNVSEALYQIYQNVLSLNDEKLDKSVYDEFYDEEYTPFRETMNEVIEEIPISESSSETITKINASLINGLRIILTTQQEYDLLEESVKNYWRNLFIIRDSIPDDYESPLTYNLTDGYEFRIYNKNLQVKSVFGENWNTISSLSNLLEGAGVGDIVKDYIGSDNEDFIIAADNLSNSLKTIERATIDNDQDSFPFLSGSLYNDIIDDITIDGSRNYVESDISNSGMKKINLNLNDFFTDVGIENLTNQVNNISNAFEDIQGDMLSVTNQVNNNSDKIESIENVNTTQNTTLTSIQTKLNTINNNINTIKNDINTCKTNINNLKKNYVWSKKNIIGAAGDQQSYCIYNAKLGLAGVYYNVNFYWTGSTNWNYRWTTTSKSGVVVDKAYAKPLSNIYTETSDDNVRVLLTNEGGFMLKITGGPKNQLRNIRCHMLYKWDGTHN